MSNFLLKNVLLLCKSLSSFLENIHWSIKNQRDMISEFTSHGSEKKSKERNLYSKCSKCSRVVKLGERYKETPPKTTRNSSWSVITKFRPLAVRKNLTVTIWVVSQNRWIRTIKRQVLPDGKLIRIVEVDNEMLLDWLTQQKESLDIVLGEQAISFDK